jgi:S1-C subfamily serine protease
MQRLATALLIAGAPSSLLAQTNPAPGGSSAASASGRASSVWAATLDCMQCVVHISAGGMWVEFGAEPVFRGMHGGSLLNGDVLVAVEGLLITTAAGARRLAQAADHPVLLTIRRNGHELDVVVAKPISWKFADDSTVAGFSAKSSTLPNGTIRTIRNNGRDTTYTVGNRSRSDSAGASALSSRSPVQDSVARPVLMDRETTRGWLGIALDCLRCTVDRTDRSARDSSLRFTTPPQVVAVEPGVAQQAGFRVGDIIRTIDGLSMITVEGARRFSTMRAGERVNFVVERGKNLVQLRLWVPQPP